MGGSLMTRTTILAALLTLASLTSALAAEITAAERAACQTDYDKYCRGTFPGGGRIIACLDKHYADLGPACQKIIEGYRKK
jgi:hypothetical protein